MKLSVIITIFAIASLGFIAKRSHRQNNATGSFALLELYTSEGCSSCPSADQLLPQLIELDPNVIALSFHVDYWNRLGWNDQFSSSAFTDRQREYAQQFQLESIYTPQLIINGKYELVGSNRSSAEADIKTVIKEKALVQLSFNEVNKIGNKLKIECHTTGTQKDQNVFLALVQKHAETNVRGGENNGRKLSHTNIVRSLMKKIAEQKMDFEIPFPKDLAEDNWTLVLFSQDKNSLQITGAIIYHH